jgi:hypothetical protein
MTAKHATLKLVVETAPKEWTVEDICAELVRRDWVRPVGDLKAAVGVALSRLHRANPTQFVRVRYGVYTWQDHPDWLSNPGAATGDRGP